MQNEGRESEFQKQDQSSAKKRCTPHRKLTAEHSEIQMFFHKEPSTSDEVYHTHTYIHTYTLLYI